MGVPNVVLLCLMQWRLFLMPIVIVGNSCTLEQRKTRFKRRLLSGAGCMLMCGSDKGQYWR